MLKFKQLLVETAKEYHLTEADLGIEPQPAPTEGSAIDTAKEQVPAPDQSKENTLTPEGKRYLIELAVKALGVDSKNLSEQDKAIFNTGVTADNAEEILQRLREIIDQNN